MDELKLKAATENLDCVLSFVDERLEGLGCPAKAQMQLDVAVEEIFVNIASYAYAPGSGDAVVRVETRREPKRVTVTFIDSGAAYDPLQRPDPDITLPAEQRGIGGLGVYLVKKTMDEVSYARREGQNVLTITKNL